MTTTQIWREVVEIERVAMLAVKVSVFGEGDREAVEVSVSDPRSGCTAMVSLTPDTYTGVAAVRAELERQIAANRKGTARRVRAEKAVS